MTGTLLATATTLIVAAGYAFSCAFWPLRDCWCCDGRGHHRPEGDDGKRGRISRPCRWCRQTGKRWRIGRRLWRRFRRHRRDAR